MTAAREPLRCAGIAGVAAWLDMTPAALARAMERRPGWPVEDVTIDQQRDGHPYRGWLPERRPEWEAWKASRPGQGAGGGRPRKDPGSKSLRAYRMLTRMCS